MPIAQIRASASVRRVHVSSGTLDKAPKSGMVMLESLEALGEGDEGGGSGRRVNVMIWVMDGWRRQDWVIAWPMAPVAPTMRIFIGICWSFLRQVGGEGIDQNT